MSTLPQVDLAAASFTVRLVDGREFARLRIMPGDIVKTERQYDIAAGALEHGAKLEWSLYMLWMSARRRGYEADFDTWIEQVEVMDVVSAPPVPSDPAQ